MKALSQEARYEIASYVLAIGALSLLASPSLRAEERSRPGKWEIVFTGYNPHTSTTCLTAAMTQGMNGTPEAARANIETTAAARLANCSACRPCSAS